MAYHAGKAANIAATATINQTSLPSHTGPIAPMACSRPASSRPRTPCSIPTPKSKPSRSRKPVHRTAMTTNQNVVSDIGAPDRSGGRLEDRHVVVGVASVAGSSGALAGSSSLRAKRAIRSQSTTARAP